MTPHHFIHGAAGATHYCNPDPDHWHAQPSPLHDDPSSSFTSSPYTFLSVYQDRDFLSPATAHSPPHIPAIFPAIVPAIVPAMPAIEDPFHADWPYWEPPAPPADPPPPAP